MPDYWGRPAFNDFAALAGSFRALRKDQREESEFQEKHKAKEYLGAMVGGKEVSPDQPGFNAAAYGTAVQAQSKIKAAQSDIASRGREDKIREFETKFASTPDDELNKIDFGTMGKDALAARIALGKALERRRGTADAKASIDEIRAKAGVIGFREFSQKRNVLNELIKAGDMDAAIDLAVDISRTSNNAYRAEKTDDGNINIYTIKEGNRQKGQTVPPEQLIQFINSIGQKQFAQQWWASMEDATRRNFEYSQKPVILQKDGKIVHAIPRASPYTNTIDEVEVYDESGKKVTGPNGTPFTDFSQLYALGYKGKGALEMRKAVTETKKPESIPNTPSMWDPEKGEIVKNPNYVPTKSGTEKGESAKISELKGRLDFLLRRSFASNKNISIFAADGNLTPEGEDALMKAQAYIEEKRNISQSKLSLQEKRKFKEANDALHYWAAVRDLIMGNNQSAGKPTNQSSGRSWKDY